jgi:hypothetical protein
MIMEFDDNITDLVTTGLSKSMLDIVVAVHDVGHCGQSDLHDLWIMRPLLKHLFHDGDAAPIDHPRDALLKIEGHISKGSTSKAADIFSFHMGVEDVQHKLDAIGVCDLPLKLVVDGEACDEAQALL